MRYTACQLVKYQLVACATNHTKEHLVKGLSPIIVCPMIYFDNVAVLTLKALVGKTIDKLETIYRLDTGDTFDASLLGGVFHLLQEVKFEECLL